MYLLTYWQKTVSLSGWFPRGFQQQVEQKCANVWWLHIWPLCTWRCLLPHCWKLCWRLKCMTQQACQLPSHPKQGTYQRMSVSPMDHLPSNLNKPAGSLTDRQNISTSKGAPDKIVQLMVEYRSASTAYAWQTTFASSVHNRFNICDTHRMIPRCLPLLSSLMPHDWVEIYFAMAASTAGSDESEVRRRMLDWRLRVLAAEAKKAGDANKATWWILSTPVLTSRLAWIHCVKSEVAMRQRPLQRNLPHWSRCSWPVQSKQQSTCKILDALKQALSRLRASCAMSKAYQWLCPDHHKDSLGSSGRRGVPKWHDLLDFKK